MADLQYTGNNKAYLDTLARVGIVSLYHQETMVERLAIGKEARRILREYGRESADAYYRDAMEPINKGLDDKIAEYERIDASMDG